MSTPDRRRTSVWSLVADVDRRLRRHHLTRAQRAAITSDLLADLTAARADGRDPAAVLGTDPDTFVADLLAASGHMPAPRDTRRLTLMTTAAAVPIVALAYLLVVDVITPAASAVLTTGARFPVAGPAVAFAAITAVAVLGTLGVLAVVVAGRPGARATMTAAAVGLTLAGLVGALGNVWVIQVSAAVSAASVTLQVAVVVVPLALALVAARWWGLRASAV